VDIGSIRQLAWVATIGVVALIFTNLIFLPIILSYIGVRVVPGRAVTTPTSKRSSFVHQLLGKFTDKRWATITLGFAIFLAIGAAVIRTQLKIGDTDQGAPELRADSRYNLDDHFITTHYRAGSYLFAVMVKTADGECGNNETVRRVDALEWSLAQLPGVQSTRSAASFDRYLLTVFNEGHPKWYDLTPNVSLLNNLTARVPHDLVNESCSLLSIFVQLKDHKADTLDALVAAVEEFKREYDSQHATFLLAAGNGGIAAATNLVVRKANQRMLFLVFCVVTLLCFIAFRSWRAVVCVLLPLMLSSLLCEALMVVLGIGVKVTTLPVIALGVGIGVDYALYVMSVMLAQLRLGATLSQAYEKSIQFTGKVVFLTGVTLAVGVFTWIFSPIKFQADMGALLVFMFLWNMFGALVLLPALASWLMNPPGQNVRAVF
jgi:predicted RND superfamily exporter protein